MINQVHTVSYRDRGSFNGMATPKGVADTEVGGPSADPRERRQSPRLTLRRPLLGIPVLPDGRPGKGQPMTGMAANVSSGGLGMEFEAQEWRPSQDLVVGMAGPDSVMQFAGVSVRNKNLLPSTQVRVGGQFGGIGRELLQADLLAPHFVPESMSFATRFPEDVLEAWCGVGVLRPVLVDRVQLCPKCHGLPTVRPGCRQCGSAEVGNDQLIHHFACAYVGPVSAFETPAGLVCPKCRTRQLVVGSDYEYLTGPYRCRQCEWSDMELEQVVQCLRCGFRCPGHQAHLQDLRGYRAHRLDPLALLAPPGTDSGPALGPALG